MILLVLLASVQAIRTGRRVWIVLATAFQWQFGMNALFHLSTWIVLGDYSPGAVTAAVVSIPATVFFLCWVRREQRATGRELALAIAIGTAIAGLAIGFLFL
ncbi:HXXEE domain-containing protein [Enemella evansiae]|uniref:HXXEE domain-containing protein n=1 Tax=Enemella evansiae TaxID=2016499 RepID=UPI0015562D73|nr:HXXEE domain-containing protein [Enemella evansiae]